MKIGISYNLFDGEELLKSSIKSIRGNVDYISVVYQTISNFGNPCEEGLVTLLDDMVNEGLIDELFEYTPKINKGGHFNEVTKRNIGLYLSEGVGCTHHMTMDSDEFYTDEQFKYMKKVMEEGDYDSSACQLVTYYKEPIYRIDPKEDYYVAVLFKIKSGMEFMIGRPYPVLVDPTRRPDAGHYKIFSREEVEMHHMSYLRKNIRRKLQNSSAVGNFKERVDKLVDYHNKWKYPKKALFAGAPDKLFNIKKVEKLFDSWE